MFPLKLPLDSLVPHSAHQEAFFHDWYERRGLALPGPHYDNLFHLQLDQPLKPPQFLYITDSIL